MEIEFADRKAYGARFEDLPLFIQEQILEARKRNLKNKLDPVLEAKKKWLKAKIGRSLNDNMGAKYGKNKRI